MMVAVEGPVDQRGLHQGDRGETGRRHGPSISAGCQPLGDPRRGDRGAGGVPIQPRQGPGQPRADEMW
jgi:hypothetical protein